MLAATVAGVPPPGTAVGDRLLPHGALPYPTLAHPALLPSAEGVVVFPSRNWPPAATDPFTVVGAAQMDDHPPLQLVYVPTRFARPAGMLPPPQDPPCIGLSAGTLRFPGTCGSLGSSRTRLKALAPRRRAALSRAFSRYQPLSSPSPSAETAGKLISSSGARGYYAT